MGTKDLGSFNSNVVPFVGLPNLENSESRTTIKEFSAQEVGRRVYAWIHDRRSWRRCRSVVPMWFRVATQGFLNVCASSFQMAADPKHTASRVADDVR